MLSDLINDLAGQPGPDRDQAVRRRAGGAATRTPSGLAPKLEQIDGLVDLYNGVPEPAPSWSCASTAAAAARLGLTPEAGGGPGRGRAAGRASAGEVRSDERTIDVRVRAPDACASTRSRLGAIPDLRPGGRPDPAGRAGHLPDTRVRCRADPGEPAADDRDHRRRRGARRWARSWRDVQSGPRRRIPRRLASGSSWAGQYEGQQEAFRSLLLVLALAVAERDRRHAHPVRVVPRAARDPAGRAALVRGRAGAAAAHRHAAQRLVLHGPDPAGGADREERHHPARLHPAPHARAGRSRWIRPSARPRASGCVPS